MLGCSRFDTINDQATGDSFAILIGEPFEQSRGLVWFERRRGHGAVKPAGRGLPVGGVLVPLPVGRDVPRGEERPGRRLPARPRGGDVDLLEGLTGDNGRWGQAR